MADLSRSSYRRTGAGALPKALAMALFCLAPVSATYGQETALSVPMVAGLESDSALAYADLVDLALPAQVALSGEISKVIKLKPEEAPGVPNGMVRLYIEASITALLIGPEIGESVRFLADVPLDARGKVPKIRTAEILVLARTVPNRPGELQLVSPDAMLGHTPAREATLRAILSEAARSDAPPPITALREVLHVSGNLAGEGETQLFLATATGAPVSISVLRRPGQPPSWGVSFTEIVDSAARAPLPATLAWYRLACGLPERLPPRANISGTLADRRIAAEDYAFVLADLGPCTRKRAVR